MSFRCKQGESSSNGPVWESGLVSAAPLQVAPVSAVVVPVGKNLIITEAMRADVGDVVPQSSSGGEEISTVLDSSIKNSVDNNEDLMGEAHIEKGEFNADCADHEFNGEFVDFAEFEGEFEFGIGEEFGEVFGDDEMNFQDDSVAEKVTVVDIGMDDDVAVSDVETVKGPMAFDQYSDHGVIVPDEEKIPENGSVIEKDFQAKKDGKKKQVRGSGSLLGEN